MVCLSSQIFKVVPSTKLQIILIIFFALSFLFNFTGIIFMILEDYSRFHFKSGTLECSIFRFFRIGCEIVAVFFDLPIFILFFMARRYFNDLKVEKAFDFQILDQK